MPAVIVRMPFTMTAVPSTPTRERANLRSSQWNAAARAAHAVMGVMADAAVTGPPLGAGAGFVVGQDAGEERLFQVGAHRVEVSDEPTGVHDHDAVGDPGDLVEMVAADEHGGPRPRPAGQSIAEQEDRGGVEGVARLVEDDEARVVLERRGQADALAVAERESAEAAAA